MVPSAQADEGGARVGVVPLRVSGEVSPHWRGMLEEGLSEGLAKSQMQVVQLQADCETAKCFVELAQKERLNFVVVASVQVNGRDYALEIRAFEPGQGREVSNTGNRCELCGIGEAKALFASQAGQLARKIQGLEVPRVVIYTEPAGATVRVDGKTVGVTPANLALTPGNHSIDLELAGYANTTRQISAAPGSQDRIDIELVPANKTDRRRRRMRIAGLTMLIPGAAMTAAGISLMAIDSRQAKGGRCDGSDVDGEGNCRFLYDTINGGIALTAVGGAAMIAGMALLVVSKRDRRGKNPKVAVGPWRRGAFLAMEF